MTKPAEAKHTPGPWTVNPSGDDSLCAAEVLSHAGQDDEEIVADGVSNRNAPLIAAAPDLLEAARAVRKLLPEYKDADAFVLLDSAIAKAEGVR